MCGKTFGCDNNLKRHIETVHENLRPFKCDVCSKAFGLKKTLQEHRCLNVVQSVPKKQFVQSVPKKQFVQSVPKKQFVQSVPKKQFVQSVPKKQFVQSVPKKQFLCDICNMVFGSRAHLVKHIKCVHEQIKDFNCQTCGKPFGCVNNLKRHIETVHEKLRPFKCDVCLKAFGLKKTLQEHKCHVTPTHDQPGNSVHEYGQFIDEHPTDESVTK